MKKYGIYITLLIVGIVLGAIFFGSIFNRNEDIKGDAINHEHATDGTQMWTCSMHPQIMQPEPGDCPICGMDLIPAESGEDGLSVDQFRLTENALALANIQTLVVGNSSEANSGLKLSGKIMENEEANAVQSSYFKGRVEKLYVNFTGEEVNRGELLARIYAPQLVAAQQELITTAALKESQPQLYKAVRNKLKLWKISEAQINKIEASGKVQEYFPVYATVSGTVSEKMVSEGDYVEQGQPLFKIANLNTVWAVFDVYENQLPLLKVGQGIAITTNAFPNEQIQASIDFIDPTLNTGTRTVQARAVLSNRNGLLKPGMFVRGTIESLERSTNEHLTIPESAVLWTGERSVVYVKPNSSQPVFEMREVTLGLKHGDSYQVLGGLSSGEEIVTNGTFTVDAAAQLRGKRSMMNTLTSEVSASNMQMEFTSSFQKEFMTVLTAYLHLKDAFVVSNSTKVREQARAMHTLVEELPMSTLGTMEAAHIKTVKRMLTAIVENETLENQRDHFIVLSENIIAISMSFTQLPDTLYIQKCPMANSNKGASWISESAEIRNPYYGEAMLTCGSVIDTLKNN
ncbi:efflux RND transporter periplasmic adaptor subunit [Altibacter sp.]|uniref:efflux RND transporter periplasmic adaptor subunit n=1 Tax=Altibacter sp. TaxID=2024823 RepID=UPI000C8D5146|nr:efflux RND transporter periplasmic adaptor subunit [Altibacter sp.]MAP53541.1 efflux transporter periplasmic adaptor subunit [Altibacter sp.]